MKIFSFSWDSNGICSIYTGILQVVWKMNFFQRFFNVFCCVMIQWPDKCLVMFMRFWFQCFLVQKLKSWSDKPKSITPDCLTLWEQFVSTWSISVSVLSVVLVFDVIISSKILPKIRNYLQKSNIFAILLLPKNGHKGRETKYYLKWGGMQKRGRS